MTREEWKKWQFEEATARNEARAAAQHASGEYEYFRTKAKVNFQALNTAGLFKELKYILMTLTSWSFQNVFMLDLGYFNVQRQ